MPFKDVGGFGYDELVEDVGFASAAYAQPNYFRRRKKKKNRPIKRRKKSFRKTRKMKRSAKGKRPYPHHLKKYMFKKGHKRRR